MGTECPVEHSNLPIEEKEGFDWDARMQGLVLSSFSFGYVTTQLVGGILAEQFGGKWIFGVCILVFGCGDGDRLDCTMSNTLRQNSSKSSVSLSISLPISNFWGNFGTKCFNKFQRNSSPCPYLSPSRSS